MNCPKTTAIVLSVMLCFALCSYPVAAEPEHCEPGYSVTFDTTSSGLPIYSEPAEKFVPAGESIEFDLEAGDSDCTESHIWCTDTLDIGGWPEEYTITRTAGGAYESKDNLRNMPPGTEEHYTITFQDGGCYYDDPDPGPFEFTVGWVGVLDIQGDFEVCPGATPTYTAITDPADHGDDLGTLVTWYVDDQPVGGGSTYGPYIPNDATEIKLKAQIGESSITKTIYVGTMPEPNRVPISGGTGSCCSSGGAPVPSYFRPYVEPRPVCCECGDEDTFVNVGCSYIGSLYTDGSGVQHPVLDSDPTDIGNGVTVTRLSSNGETTGYTKTDGADNTTVYGLPVNLVTGSSAGYSRKTSVTDADGRETIYSRDANGALDYMELPNGDTWEYEHTLTSPARAVTWITKITAPDGTYTTIDYETSGAALGKVSAVAQYDAYDSPLSETEYTYDGCGRVTSADVNGHVVTYAYNGNIVTMIDTSADPEIVTVYTYGDGTTSVTRKHATDSNLDQTTTYYFHKLDGQNAYLWKVQDPTGGWTYYGTYVPDDEESVPSGTSDTDYIKTNDLDLIGKVFRVEDALARVTEYDYDSGTGALLSVTYPDDSTEEYVYYLDGQEKTRWLMAVENVRGHHTFYKRNGNALHQVEEVKVAASDAQAPEDWTDPDDWTNVDPIKEYDYYTSGQQIGLLQTETVPDIEGTTDYTKTYSYLKDLGNSEYRLEPGPTTVTYQWWNNDPQSPAYDPETDETEYDAMGRVLSTTDADDRVISNTFDAQGRQLTTTYGTGGPTTESHYSCCTLEWSRDEEGRYTYYAYDDANRVTDVWTSLTGQSETNPLVHYTYDCFGNVATVTTFSDAYTDRTTAYTYDKNNRVVQIDYPTVSQGQDALASEHFGYDAVGNLLGKMVGESGDNKTTLYEYDELNRLTDVYYAEDYADSLSDPDYPQNADVTYTYDGGSRLRETMTDAHSVRPTRYTYDLQDRLVSYKPATPRTLGQDEEYDTDVREIGYVYNNLGQKTQMSLSIDGGNPVLDVDYLYYANGWLKEVQENSASIAEYIYDEVGNRTRVDLGNDAYSTYDYHSTDPRYFVSEIEHFRPDDQSIGAITYSQRDDSGNPTSVTYPGGTVSYTYDPNNRLASESSSSFGYDWVGNRLNPPANPNPMVYDNTDKLVLWPGAQSFKYDPSGTGSLWQSWNAAGTTLNKTWEYTGAELVSSVTHNSVQNSPSSSMTWDADANRVSFTSSTGGTTEFVYDTTAGIPAVIEENDGDPVYYIREPNGALIARIDSATTNYYHFDALGSTRFLTNGSGTATDTYTYDAWGKQTASTGSTAQPYRYVGQLGYYSHYQDTNLFDQSGYQFLQLGVRFYDALTGRFTQADPIQDGLNWYSYVGGKPLMWADPFGLMSRWRFVDMWDAYIGGTQNTPYHLPISELNLDAIDISEWTTMYGLINAGRPGKYQIDEYRIVSFDPTESLFDAYAIGSLELRIRGTLEICSGNSWTFNGRAVGDQDTFDFQRSTHRTRMAEFLTTLGRSFEGVGARPYPVSIDGYAPVAWASLHRPPAQYRVPRPLLDPLRLVPDLRMPYF